MSYSKIILRDSADIVWPLDDIDQSSSVSKPINFYTDNPYTYSASISVDHTDVTDIPIVFGGGTALRFVSSSVGMSIPALGRFSEIYSNKHSCVSFWFQTESLSVEERPIFKKRNFDNVGLFIKNNYLIFRYGNSASYSEVSLDIPRPYEPNHIIVGKTQGSLLLIINGELSSSPYESTSELSIDSSHSDNDYIDFYGPSNNSWIIDSVSMYPNMLNSIDAKRHYIYGLGKYVGDDIFHSLGGTIYNFSTINTEKIFSINWRYPQEWRYAEFNDLINENSGIRPLKFNEPEFYSYNEDILTSSDSISFRNSSGSAVNAAYIDINNLYQKIGNGENPFFVKVKFDGDLPKQYEKQRILSFGYEPDNEILKFNLYNNSGSYKILIEGPDDSSTQFDIVDIESQPEAYIGMRYSQYSQFYFAQSGSYIQTSSFNFYNENNYGLDPVAPYMPPAEGTIVRIGSALSYTKNSYQDSLPSVNQFSGTFKKFCVMQKDFSASYSMYQDIEQYLYSRYSISFDSNKNRFKTFSYGNVNFNLHAIDIAQFNNDEDQRLSANIINIGYPDVPSSSQVMMYVTHYDYSGSVIYPKTRVYQNDTIPFINNKNISGTYLKFDLDIHSEDSTFYPPKIKGFSFESYSGDTEKVRIRHDDGQPYYLYNSSSYVYLPEIKETPNIFISKESGIKMINSISEFTEDFTGKPLDPRTIDGLALWLDSRFINGLNVTNPVDDSHVTEWKDLSGNDKHAIQGNIDLSPVFRLQSLNMLTNNQGNGGENGLSENIIGVNCSASPSPDGAVSGVRGIKTIPDGSTTESYIELGRNTASFTIVPNNSYSILGSVKLLKPQTASYLHPSSRSIEVYVDSGSGLVLTASTTSASNISGIYNLYSEFTAPSVVLDCSIRFYNGSFSQNDEIYWDNMALYPRQSGSYITSWSPPLTTDNDIPSVKFNGSAYLESSASAGPMVTYYRIIRDFENNQDNTFLIDVLSGSYTINSVTTGSGGFLGDSSVFLLYYGIHNDETRNKIEDWLTESFNLS